MKDKITNLAYLAGATRFRRISEKLYVDGDKIYEDNAIDFKASWFSVYYILATTDQPKTVLDLADEIGFTHITVKNVVREMEASQLVHIRENPEDKRSKHITLTTRGERLFERLQKIWAPFADTIKQVLDAGHPDFLNIIHRIDQEVSKKPIYARLKQLDQPVPIRILDYKPSLKKYLYELAGQWLTGALGDPLEEEEQFTLHHPDKAYLETGGFVFFALYENTVVGCVALKRLDENAFELARLFIDPNVRNQGIATRLIERSITRCKENEATQLWLQTTLRMQEAHLLYYRFGFEDRKAPEQMTVLRRTEKIMVLDL